jgi:hypothetical protein
MNRDDFLRDEALGFADHGSAAADTSNARRQEDGRPLNSAHPGVAPQRIFERIIEKRREFPQEMKMPSPQLHTAVIGAS